MEIKVIEKEIMDLLERQLNWKREAVRYDGSYKYNGGVNYCGYVEVEEEFKLGDKGYFNYNKDRFYEYFMKHKNGEVLVNYVDSVFRMNGENGVESCEVFMRVVLVIRSLKNCDMVYLYGERIRDIFLNNRLKSVEGLRELKEYLIGEKDGLWHWGVGLKLEIRN